jgi:hypothetical protein
LAGVEFMVHPLSILQHCGFGKYRNGHVPHRDRSAKRFDTLDLMQRSRGEVRLSAMGTRDHWNRFDYEECVAIPVAAGHVPMLDTFPTAGVAQLVSPGRS